MPPFESYPIGLYGYHDFPDNDVEGICLPLTGVSIEANVHDFIAEVKLSQSYKNTETVAVEAIYHFPVDESASVCSFLAEYDDGTVVKGVVEEKKKARKDYDQALDSGRRANLLEVVRRDVFTLNVGNLPPGGSVKISITYVTSLKARDNAAAFILPTYVAPRYSPPNSKTNASEIEALKEQASFGNLVGLDIKAKFHCLSNIERITIPTHPNEQSYSCDLHGKMGHVTLTNISMDRDLVLLIEEERAHQPRACIEKTEDGRMAGLVTIFPKLEFRDERCEIIFIIDRSASMNSAKIQQARDALLLFLRALPPSCSFNIVAFGSYFESLFDNPKPYNDETLEQASRYVEQMSANMGGTEIKSPLENVLKREIPPHTKRQVFVLTDGQVTNDKEVFSVIQKQCTDQNSEEGRCRVFSLGIGGGVSRHLVEGIARAGRGTAVFVEEGDLDSLRAKVAKQLKQALQPSLDKVSIQWNFPAKAGRKDPMDQDPSASAKNLLHYRSPGVDKGLTGYRLFPTHNPPAFNKEKLLSFALFPADARDLPESVTIKCESPDGPLEVTVEVSDGDIFHGKAIHRMTARTAISEYENRRKGYGYENEGIVSCTEALQLALDYDLVSEQTSFVAIEEVATEGSNNLDKRVIPQQVSPPESLTLETPAYVCCMPVSIPSIGDILSRAQPIETLEDQSGFLCERADLFKKKSRTMYRSFINFGAVGRSIRSLVHRSKGSTTSRTSVAKSVQLLPPPPATTKTTKVDYYETKATTTSPPIPTTQESTTDKMLHLCLLQKANGSFHLNDALAHAIDLHIDAIRHMASESLVGVTTASPLDPVVFATTLAVAALRVLFSEKRDEWELQEKKALDWLASYGISESDANKLIDQLENKLQAKNEKNECAHLEK